MRVTFDERADALYIELTASGESRRVARTYMGDEAQLHGHDINLDFDPDGKLIGIEIFGASGALRHTALAAFRHTADHLNVSLRYRPK